LSAGCTSAETSKPDDAVPPSPSAPAPVITAEEAKRVFEQYDRENAAADAALDDSAIRKIQTGVLLKESLAEFQIHRKAKTKDGIAHFTKPRFMIPVVEAREPYPRYFAVMSKRKGEEEDRSSLLFYFTQTQAEGPWKAAAATWALTEPLKKSPTVEPTPTLAPTKNGKSVVRLRPKQLPDIRRGASGTAQLSATAVSDRAACNSFADYVSFSPPHGRPADDRFTEGGFTSDLVRFYNGWADEDLDRSISYKVVGMDLPVFRLSTGSSLVACTFVREHRVAGAGPHDTVQFDKGADTDVLLGGDGKEWRRVVEVSSVTALIEVSAGKASPATVLACDCYGPQLLSATGVRPN
jgi:hypothetical protein